MGEARVISVFGGSGVAPGSREHAAAEQVGRVLAGLGYAVATGGYGGAMAAVSRAAAQAGAEVIGVTCRAWRAEPNRFLTRSIETRDYYERLRVLVEVASAGYVVLPGGTGTLVELALVWELAAKGAGPARPVVCVGDCWIGVRDALAARDPSAAARVRFVGSPEQLGAHFPAAP